eukprot:1502153-Rhodomonas_salina.1
MTQSAPDEDSDESILVRTRCIPASEPWPRAASRDVTVPLVTVDSEPEKDSESEPEPEQQAAASPSDSLAMCRL